MEAISISFAWLPATPNQLLHPAVSTPQSHPCYPAFLIRARSFAHHFLSVRPLRRASTGLFHASNVAETIPHREREQSHATGITRRYMTKKDDERSNYKRKELGGKEERRVPAKSRAEGNARKPRKMGIWIRKDKEEEARMAEKRNKKSKQLSKADADLRAGLDMCSKTGDVIRAIALYDSTVRQGIKLEQYHYNVLLYLCSSAASGVVQPAKSGSSSANEFSVELTEYSSAHEEEVGDELTEGVDKDGFLNKTNKRTNDGGVPIQVSEDLRNYARSRGFEIFEAMKSENIPMSEAALTSVARMAASMGNGDMAFEMVKQMKPQNVTPRLRSYGPALSAFCSKGDVERAFEVEAHMLASGVYPEEPELAALLSASIAAGRGDNVYYLLHKLRTKVRQVSPSTAALLEAWFKSSAAAKVGKRKWDAKMVAQAIEDGGGGWHGLGWLGRGKWNVVLSSIDDNGFCMSCKDKLVTIDIDPVETENFASSVASLANKRERNASFQKFQKWLDYYGPFEAVVDAANVGLFSQKRFSINKVNAVVSAIRQKLPTKRWPLIIVHNRRLIADKINGPINVKVLEKWRNADAIYATPTGSNDDWYWLYAAIKFKCLIVTNDEMRDHIFQILGNDFFPRWKERHQVHFSFHDGSFEFHLPPPCSVVIQESKRGHWHIPISSESEQERRRTWLCVTRAKATTSSPDSATEVPCVKKKATTSLLTYPQGETTSNEVAPKEHQNGMAVEGGFRRHPGAAGNHEIVEPSTIVNHIEAAENLCGCAIDFQI